MIYPDNRRTIPSSAVGDQDVPRVAPDIELDPSTQKELSRLVRAPSTPQAVALRARIILAAAQRRSNQEIAATLGITQTQSPDGDTDS